MYDSKGLSYNYLEFVGYETRENLIWKSGKCFRNTNKIGKQGIPKSSMNIKSTSEMLVF